MFLSWRYTLTLSIVVVIETDWFFFSSRRRHTRLTCDWSSDVCSSDLSRAGCTPGWSTHEADGACGSGVPDVGAVRAPAARARAVARVVPLRCRRRSMDVQRPRRALPRPAEPRAARAQHDPRTLLPPGSRDRRASRRRL